MAVSYRGMIFCVLRQPDLTSIQKSVATALILRGDDRKHVGPWRAEINWKHIAMLTGLPPAICENAFQRLCSKGWFEVQTRPSDGMQRYLVPYMRLAQATEYRDEHRALNKERQGRIAAT